MNTHRFLGIAAILAIAIAGVASAAMAISVSVIDTQIDGTTVLPNDVIRFDMERSNDLTVKLDIISLEDQKNVEIRAFITGYEYNDIEPISKSTPLFDMTANTEYVKKLTFNLPADMEQGDYKLRIIISDRDTDEAIGNFNLKIEGARHVMKISDVVLSDSKVKDGSALLTTVRVENLGQHTENDVKVTVSVPELGLSASDYITEIKTDKQKDTEELYLRIPKCAKAGLYKLNVEVSYDRNHEKLTSSVPFEIVEADSCTPVATTQPATTVVVQPAPAATDNDADTAKGSSSGVKTALEIILLVLIGLVVVIGIVLGLSRMGGDDEEQA